MAMKKFLILAIASLCASCSTNLYLCQTSGELTVYQYASTKRPTATTIQSSHHFISKSAKPNSKGFYKVVYGNIKGYVYKPTLTKQLAFISHWPYTYTAYFVFSPEFGYYRPGVDSPIRLPPDTPSYALPKSSGYSGGTIHVRGYYRKDGTYVRPHTRSAPRRR